MVLPTLLVVALVVAVPTVRTVEETEVMYITTAMQLVKVVVVVL
jgi:hypothetical protein